MSGLSLSKAKIAEMERAGQALPNLFGMVLAHDAHVAQAERLFLTGFWGRVRWFFTGRLPAKGRKIG